jgi:hypothetical protein
MFILSLCAFQRQKTSDSKHSPSGKLRNKWPVVVVGYRLCSLPIHIICHWLHMSCSRLDRKRPTVAIYCNRRPGLCLYYVQCAIMCTIKHYGYTDNIHVSYMSLRPNNGSRCPQSDTVGCLAPAYAFFGGHISLFTNLMEGCWRQAPVFNGVRCYATSLMPWIGFA